MQTLCINTFIYAMYLKVYPFLTTYYKSLIHTAYLLSLLYHLLHNLNRFVFQFENLMLLMNQEPVAFMEHVVTRNIREALGRRVRNEVRRIGGQEAA